MQISTEKGLFKMAAKKLFPVAGINNVSTDDALQRGGDAPKLFVRDALNVDISDTGRIALRKGAERISPLGFKSIWNIEWSDYRITSWHIKRNHSKVW